MATLSYFVLLYIYDALEFKWVVFKGLITLLCLMAGGYFLNDYIDLEVDKKVHPNRALPKGYISLNLVFILSSIFFTTSLILGITTSYKMALLVIVSAFLLLIYNVALRRYHIIGNIVVSFLSASVFIFASIISSKWDKSFFIILIAFLFSLSREMMKDIEDIRGDRKSGYRTLPIVKGVKFTFLLSRFVFIAGIFVIIASFFTREFSYRYILSSIFLVIIPSTIFLIFKWKPQSVSVISKYIKAEMIAFILVLFIEGLK
ncbi:hypothetical protein DRJ22_05365 [Candidatus Woesearchaeota archaeon]|nr:MAG: hypothetical protein DRJ22_05365 [Candidatus Woesearchaeota archaeon]